MFHRFQTRPKEEAGGSGGQILPRKLQCAASSRWAALVSGLLPAPLCAAAVFSLGVLPQGHALPSSAAAHTDTRHALATRHASAGGVKKVKTARVEASSVRGKRAGEAYAAGRAASPARKSRSERALEGARSAAATIETVKLNSAFLATAQLRPMAQQLASTRSGASFSGVLGYAQSHPGVGAATAYLALGHAYVLDHKYPDAVEAYKSAAQAAGSPSEGLADYAEFLAAQALLSEQKGTEAYPLLDRFAERHPGSIFAATAPVELSEAHLQQHDASGALKALEPLAGTPDAERPGYKLALARAYQMAGDTARAIALDRDLFDSVPLSYEATQARAQMTAMGSAPSAAERKVHADRLFNAKRYSEAAAEYSAVRNDPALSQADRDALQIYSAVCDLKLKHLSRKDVDKLPATNDDTAALKLYLYAEISRAEKDRATHDGLINQLVTQHPSSRWTEEALYSGGNMYLLLHDSEQALFHYKLLVEHFPNSMYAPSSHWRMAWMNYRMRRFPEAARLMEEQVARYGAGTEAPAALYWRARLYEENGGDFAQAASLYKALNASYPNFYYGVLARQRLAVLGTQPEVAPSPTVLAIRKMTVPDLASAVPENDPHFIKAKLLANAALNEYIGPEIQASPGAAAWGALAQAQIYTSYGEHTRALQALKHSGISFFSLPASQVPASYWHELFPQPYWGDLTADAQKNALDPYLVASLIRQESEFNAGAVSPAHAYGLMQLLPSVGQENARKEGMRGFSQGQLLNPAVNLQLGTRNLRQVLDRFGGQPEYALAAYNAGDIPVRQWMASNDYKDIPEFVESIPYTETREYVQAIMRNREMYRLLYGGR